jgi:hypothetical protein
LRWLTWVGLVTGFLFNDADDLSYLSSKHPLSSHSVFCYTSTMMVNMTMATKRVSKKSLRSFTAVGLWCLFLSSLLMVGGKYVVTAAAQQDVADGIKGEIVSCSG